MYRIYHKLFFNSISISIIYYDRIKIGCYVHFALYKNYNCLFCTGRNHSFKHLKTESCWWHSCSLTYSPRLSKLNGCTLGTWPLKFNA
ncbi:hypothetical protein XENTR_v10024146 [Xenopus tropicalis]|nr:hypothetical protein XENTR_v10024146 [Xenopus tropicalis]